MTLWNRALWTFTAFWGLFVALYYQTKSLSLLGKNCLVYFFDIELSSIFQHMFEISLKLVSKEELWHLVAILQHYTRIFIFMKQFFFFIIDFQKENWNTLTLLIIFMV